MFVRIWRRSTSCSVLAIDFATRISLMSVLEISFSFHNFLKWELAFFRFLDTVSSWRSWEWTLSTWPGTVSRMYLWIWALWSSSAAFVSPTAPCWPLLEELELYVFFISVSSVKFPTRPYRFLWRAEICLSCHDLFCHFKILGNSAELSVLGRVFSRRAAWHWWHE